MIQNYNNYYMFTPFLPPNCDKPPTIYQILESIINPSADLNEPLANVKIKDLAKQGRTKIFNFDYPLSTHVSREDFETLILKHYMMRRINFDTVTAFRIMLDAKLNEIMPLYNKMFDGLDGWNIFTDGEITTRTGTDNTTSNNTTNKTSNQTDNTTTQETDNTTKQSTNSTNNNLSTTSTTGNTTTADKRFSNTPQNRLAEIRDGEYVTEYNYDTTTSNGTDTSSSQGTAQSITNDTDNSTKNNTTNSTKNNTVNSTKNDTSTDVSNGTDNKTYNETITKTPSNKIEIMKEMQENIKSIYTLIFKDLD